jgi:hypothetical protein
MAIAGTGDMGITEDTAVTEDTAAATGDIAVTEDTAVVTGDTAVTAMARTRPQGLRATVAWPLTRAARLQAKAVFVRRPSVVAPGLHPLPRLRRAGFVPPPPADAERSTSP